jgi:hypothetical protein
MRKLLMIGAVMAAVLLPTASSAQFSLGARLGYGFGMGDVGGTLAMDEWVKSQVPVQLDAMYRVTPNVGLGAYLSYGFGQTGDVCDFAGADCSARVTRLGVQATYSFAGQQFLPWIGAGIGYEWNTIDDGTDEATFTGWEFLNLQAGGDYKVNEQLSVGPYAMFSIAQYGDGEIGGFSAPISDKKMHEWLSFGVRGKFDL